MAILEVEDLSTQFTTEAGILTAVDGVSFSLDESETLAIVGESGCGKSVTAFSIMGLIDDPPGRIVAGSVRYRGTDLRALSERQMLRIRGNAISMVFQEPMTSLNPVMPIGRQIVEAIRAHQDLSKRQAEEKAVDKLSLVGIPRPGDRMSSYPHQLSGGMRQRVMIAMALACDAQVLIADEPTTALDVTIQAQIIDLLKELQAEKGISIVLITHDMGVVAELAHNVVVMYAGSVVERADVSSLFDDPQHPYSQGLLESIPNIDESKEMLDTIEGTVPSLVDMPSGCRFAARCPHSRQICLDQLPKLFETSQPSHAAACWILKNYQPDVL